MKTIATILGLAACLALAATTALAGFAGTDVYLPSVGSAVSVAPWYTTVWVYNPGPAPATARIQFLPRGTANPAPPWVDVVVPAGDTEKLENIGESPFHRQQYGALQMVCGTQRLVVTSRA